MNHSDISKHVQITGHRKEREQVDVHAEKSMGEWVQVGHKRAVRFAGGGRDKTENNASDGP